MDFDFILVQAPAFLTAAWLTKLGVGVRGWAGERYS